MAGKAASVGEEYMLVETIKALQSEYVFVSGRRLRRADMIIVLRAPSAVLDMEKSGWATFCIRAFRSLR